MTITIRFSSKKEYPLAANQLQPGRAYQSESGTVYLGVVYRHIAAVALGFVENDDPLIIFNDYNTLFREVDLDITVKECT